MVPAPPAREPVPEMQSLPRRTAPRPALRSSRIVVARLFITSSSIEPAGFRSRHYDTRSPDAIPYGCACRRRDVSSAVRNYSSDSLFLRRFNAHQEIRQHPGKTVVRRPVLLLRVFGALIFVRGHLLRRRTRGLRLRSSLLLRQRGWLLGLLYENGPRKQNECEKTCRTVRNLLSLSPPSCRCHLCRAVFALGECNPLRLRDRSCVQTNHERVPAARHEIQLGHRP